MAGMLRAEDYGVGDLANWSSLITELGSFVEFVSFTYRRGTTAGDYTTTSLLYLEKLDETNMAWNKTYTEPTLVIAMFRGVVSRSVSMTIAFDFDVDGDRVGRHGAFARWAGWGARKGTGAANGNHFSVMFPIMIGAGSHTIQPVWAVSNAGTATLQDDFAPSVTYWVPSGTLL